MVDLSSVDINLGDMITHTGPLGVAMVIGATVIAKAIVIVGRLLVTMVGDKLTSLVSTLAGLSEKVQSVERALVDVEKGLLLVRSELTEHRTEMRRELDEQHSNISGLRDMVDTRSRRPDPKSRS